MALFTQLIGAGRPDVVFLHGLFGRGKNWAGIARTLAEHEHTSVLFDLPNHGRSHWTETFDYEAMADEVMRKHPEDPEEWAFMEEHAAWYRSHTFEQGKWHRVRKVIRRRLLSGKYPPAA